MNLETLSRINQLSCSVLLLSSVIVFFVLLFGITAPYGRYSQAKGWGALIPCKLAWFVMESPNLWMSIIVYYLISTQKSMLPSSSEPPIEVKSYQSLPNLILIGLYFSHYVHRSIIYPLKMTGGNPMPLTVMLSACFFCAWNGFNLSTHLLILNQYDDSWLYDPRFLIGVALFIYGWTVNIQSDNILLKLRSEAITPSDNEVKFKYKIPHGGMFEYVSCANYYGEIVEWIGFGIACWSLPGMTFSLATFCNVAPRAINHHRWYQQKFENYPKSRKAVIPLIW